MRLIDHITGFEWDKANRDKNWQKHRVAWWECEEVFLNLPLFVFPDPRHSQKEARFYALGKTSVSRHLFIVFTVRQSRIRIISARDMNRKEEKVYAEKTQEASQI
jgi:hypothetical protein